MNNSPAMVGVEGMNGADGYQADPLRAAFREGGVGPDLPKAGSPMFAAASGLAPPPMSARRLPGAATIVVLDSDGALGKGLWMQYNSHGESPVKDDVRLRIDLLLLADFLAPGQETETLLVVPELNPESTVWESADKERVVKLIVGSKHHSDIFRDVRDYIKRRCLQHQQDHHLFLLTSVWDLSACVKLGRDNGSSVTVWSDPKSWSAKLQGKARDYGATLMPLLKLPALVTVLRTSVSWNSVARHQDNAFAIFDKKRRTAPTVTSFQRTVLNECGLCWMEGPIRQDDNTEVTYARALVFAPSKDLPKRWSKVIEIVEGLFAEYTVMPLLQFWSMIATGEASHGDLNASRGKQEDATERLFRRAVESASLGYADPDFPSFEEQVAVMGPLVDGEDVDDDGAATTSPHAVRANGHGKAHAHANGGHPGSAGAQGAVPQANGGSAGATATTTPPLQAQWPDAKNPTPPMRLPDDTASEASSGHSHDEASPCQYSFMCKHGLRCKYHHTSEEKQFFGANHGVGKLQYKSTLCTNNFCPYGAESYNCYRAHGVDDLFCSNCKGRGHSYHSCPTPARRNAAQFSAPQQSTWWGGGHQPSSHGAHHSHVHSHHHGHPHSHALLAHAPGQHAM